MPSFPFRLSSDPSGRHARPFVADAPVLHGPLQPNTRPGDRSHPTGFYRDGYCWGEEEDFGQHYVAGIMTKEFLEFSKRRGECRHGGGVGQPLHCLSLRACAQTGCVTFSAFADRQATTSQVAAQDSKVSPRAVAGVSALRGTCRR